MISSTSGTLYLVSTPIGNLEDLTLRAKRVLAEVGVIAAEDTRHTQQLLARYDIHTPLTSYHDHNKEEKAPVLIERLRQGQSIALVSDAGTPTISDPGYLLITGCIAANIPVSPLPGPSAPLAALAASGLPTDAFLFAGFLPRKPGARLKRLEALAPLRETLILFESPHRLVRLLEEVQARLGDRRVAVCRELTKLHEEIIRGRVSEAVERLKGKTVKGEITIVIEGNR
ncbi:MAG TPA: 16S rRNA (cytidine(1402)-2'-O)-methyltransferase [Nitrospiria bacterium]|nr:16S rRNA (cytidine(1402)-2'-O)-methyltransferase [Nitrospiria bacterium]